MHQELPVVDIMPNEEYIKVSFQENFCFVNTLCGREAKYIFSNSWTF